MPRFFFHLQSLDDTLIDEEGTEFTLAQAMEFCLVSARHLMSADVHTGTLDLTQCILLTDADGQLIAEVPFHKAIKFQNPATIVSDNAALSDRSENLARLAAPPIEEAAGCAMS